MAYGLDFDEVYYTDHDREDIGVLNTYEINIDLAREKDFSIESPEPVIPVKGFWYIQDTEYGGIIDAFETDSDEEMITYSGRTFRGLLNSHYVDIRPQVAAYYKELKLRQKKRSVSSKKKAIVNAQGASTEIENTTITDLMRVLIEESNLDDCFVVDEPEVEESVSTLLNNYTVSQGTTLYDALVGMAESIDFTFLLRYKSDHMVHITPILAQDYTDYIKGSKYDAIGFKTELDTARVNHLIVNAVGEDGTNRVAHFFTDENGGLQPYSTVDNPIKDEQYIKDKRSQVLFGIDEVAEYQETSDSAEENYEMLTEAPWDWEINFGSYYKIEVSEGAEPNYKEYEAVGEDVYTAQTSQPADWATNYSSYYQRHYDESSSTYTRVVNPTGNPSARKWYELTGSGYIRTADTYVVSGKRYYTTEWTYQNYSGDSAPDYNNVTPITVKPADWESNYSEYTYKFQTGTGFEYRHYEGKSVDYFVKMTKQPSDWKTNYSSYYRKLFKKEKKKDGKPNISDYVKYDGAYYTTVKKDDDGKGTGVPKFTSRNHYRKETKIVAPSFKSNNCYRIGIKEVAPTYLSDNCYSLTTEYHAPIFIVGEGYRKVFDHYSHMVETAIEFFQDEMIKSSQELELDYFDVNIGDTIGGTDEFSKTFVVGKVSNIEAKIENGLIDVFYKVDVEAYRSALIHGTMEDE